MRRKAYRQPTFWLLLVSLFVVNTANSGIVLHLMPYVTERGINAGSTVRVISVFTASGVVSTVSVGVLSDRTPSPINVRRLSLVSQRYWHVDCCRHSVRSVLVRGAAVDGCQRYQRTGPDFADKLLREKGHEVYLRNNQGAHPRS